MGYLEGIVAWYQLIDGGWASVVGIAMGLVLMAGIAWRVAKTDRGTLVLRIEQVDDDDIPRPHVPRRPPEVSLYARGVLFVSDEASTDGHFTLRGFRVAPYELSRLGALCGIEPRFLGPGTPRSSTRVSDPSPKVVFEGRRYFGARVADVDLPEVRRRLLDLSWLPDDAVSVEIGFNIRYMIRLIPVHQTASGATVLPWEGEDEPETYGHPIVGMPGVRCDTVGASDPILAAPGGQPYPVLVRGTSGTVYRVEVRELAPHESPDCDRGLPPVIPEKSRRRP